MDAIILTGWGWKEYAVAAREVSDVLLEMTTLVTYYNK